MVDGNLRGPWLHRTTAKPTRSWCLLGKWHPRGFENKKSRPALLESARQALVSADMCLGHSSEARESQYLPGHGKRIWPHANAHLTPSRARLSGPIQRAGSNAGDRPTDGVGLTARGRAPSPPKKALAAEAAATEAGDRFGVPGSHVADRGLSINERGARAPRAEA